MAVVENRFVCDLSKPVQAQALKGNVFSLDNLGSRLSVLVYENGLPITISGTVTANFILPDGSTVNVNGGLTTENGGSKAYVNVPQSCLLIPGILKIAIKITASGVITTLAAIVANVYMTKTDNVITPSQQVITDWNAEISAAIASQNATITGMKDAMGQYVCFTLNRIAGAGTYWNAWVEDVYIKSGSKVKVVLDSYGGNYLTNVKVNLHNGTDWVGDDNWISPAAVGGSCEFTAAGNATRIRFQFITSQDDGAITAKMLLRTNSEYGIGADITDLYGKNSALETRVGTAETNIGNAEKNITLIQTKENQFAYNVILKQTITSKTGYYDGSGFHSASGFTAAEYSCNQGELLLVTCSGNSGIAGYYFYDSNGAKVSQSDLNKSFLDATVAVPYGAVKIGLNKLNNTDFTIRAISVKKPSTSAPFAFTDVYNDVLSGEGWNELVEIDNLSGVYTSVSNFAKNGTSVTGFVTKVYDVSNLSKARFSGNPYGMIGEKYDGTKVSLYGLFPWPATNAEFDVTEYRKIYVGGTASIFWGGWSDNFVKLEGWMKIDSKWRNRNIVWFGTSIPAGGFKGTDQPLSYPYQVGRLLGANVINEAVGDSGVHYRELSRVTATNPYGFNFYFVSATRCLTNTLAMMQWLGNWADYYCNGGTYKNPEEWDATIFTSGLPSSWSDADTEAIKQFSYENKLDKYLTDSTFPDLFVFDHGYNDRIRWSDAQGTYEAELEQYGRDNCYTFRGAMNFLIDRILAFNPWAKIIMIGDYENQSAEKKDDSTYQMRVAEDYEIPIYKRWEYTGWSQVQETAHYTWSSGLLNYTENSTATKTNLAWNLADGVHPHSDKTGRATRIMAMLIAPFIEKLN